MWHGCTNIDPKYPDRSATNDGIFYTQNLIAGLGFTTGKLEFSTATTTKYPYTPWGSPTTLKQLAQEASMATVLSDVRFVRWQINTFSLAITENNPWAGIWSTSVGDTIEQEMYDFAKHLFDTYPGKEFILTNWEGDWQLLNSFNPNDGVALTRLGAYRDYQRRRQRAVAKARADSPLSTCVVRYGIECNRVLDDAQYRLAQDVIGNVIPDCISLSCYEALEGWTGGITNQAAMETDIENKLTAINTKLRAVPGCASVPIIIGEYGFPQQATYWPPTLNAALLAQKVVTIATSLGFEGEIYWQCCSNELEFANSPRGFNLYNMNGSSTTVGALNSIGVYYQSIL